MVSTNEQTNISEESMNKEVSNVAVVYTKNIATQNNLFQS